MGRHKGSGRGILASVRHHLWWLQLISERLSPSNMTELRNSFVGHFFSIGDFQFQGQLYAVMLRHLRSTSKERSCLEYEIGKFRVEFGPADFALITGLKIGGEIDTPSTSNFHRDIFNGKSVISILDIKGRFEKECRVDNNSYLALQLAFLYIVYGVIIMKDRTCNGIDLGFMHLIDDLKKFKNFPWGRVSYQILVRQTHKAREIIEGLEKNNNALKCEASGFVYALQAWAYEIMPALASYCASSNTVSAAAGVPRILKWTTKLWFGYEEMHKFFLPSSCYEPVSVILSVQETEMLQILGVDQSMRVSHCQEINRVSRTKRENPTLPAPRSSQRLKKDSSEGDIGVSDQAKEVPTSNEPILLLGVKELLAHYMGQVRCEIKSIEERFDSRFKSLESRVDALNDDLKNIQKGQVGLHKAKEAHDMECDGGEKSHNDEFTGEVDRKSTPNNEARCHQFAEAHQNEVVDVENIISEEINAVENLTVPISQKEEIVLISQDLRPIKSDPFSGMKSPVHKSSSTSCSSRHHCIDNVEIVKDGGCREFDVSEILWSDKNMENFNEWNKNAKKSKITKELEVPCGLLRWVDFKWFKPLMNTRKWLDNTHIDSLLNLVVLTYDRENPEKNRDWTVVDVPVVNALVSNDFREELILPYVAGEKPMCGVPWKSCSRLFGVGNVHKNHWILFNVSFPNQEIIAYDSLGLPHYMISAYLNNLSRNIPKMIFKQNLIEEMSFLEPFSMEWPIKVSSDTPKQGNLSDCGIMVIKVLECLVRGIVLKNINPDRSYIYRKSYCVKLHAWAVEQELKRKLLDGTKK